MRYEVDAREDEASVPLVVVVIIIVIVIALIVDVFVLSTNRESEVRELRKKGEI